MLYRSTYLCAGVIAFANTVSVSAATVSVDRLELLTPAEPVNVITVRVAGGFLIGSDTEKPKLTGWADVDLELDFATGDPVLEGFSFTDGAISMSDVAFSLAFGAVTATTTGLGGTPSTPVRPGAVIDGKLNAVDHLFTINQGILVAAGEATDFAVEPLEAAGDGMGFATLTEVLPATTDTRHFTIRIDLPVAAQQVLTLDNVPLIGTTDVNIDVSGQIVSQKSFDVAIPNGDFNLDNVSDCDDLALLYERAVVTSDHATFDVDGDGMVTVADAAAWVAARGFSAGDANLDGAVDGVDLEIWQANQFSEVTDWCRGDFNVDGFVDGSDFNQWNDNRSMAAPTATVPEPNAMTLLLVAAAVGCIVQRARIPKKWL